MGGEMTQSGRVDEESLVGAVRAGDGSFAALYRHFERPVLGFFMRVTGAPDLAAHLTAETFASALEIDR
jgi:DNA-directed RNA polymerase specialized sigma24 family protein